MKEIEEELSEFEDQQQYHKLKVHTITGTSFFLTILIILIVIYCNRKLLIKVCQNSKIKSTRQDINEGRELQSLTIDNILTPTPSGISTLKAPVPVTNIRIAYQVYKPKSAVF